MTNPDPSSIHAEHAELTKSAAAAETEATAKLRKLDDRQRWNSEESDEADRLKAEIKWAGEVMDLCAEFLAAAHHLLPHDWRKRIPPHPSECLDD